MRSISKLMYELWVLLFSISFPRALSMYYITFPSTSASSWSDMNGNEKPQKSWTRAKFIPFSSSIAAKSSSFDVVSVSCLPCLRFDFDFHSHSIWWSLVMLVDLNNRREISSIIRNRSQKFTSVQWKKSRLGENKLFDDIKHICCHLFKSPPSLLQIVVTQSSNRHRRRHSMTHWFSLYKHVTNWTTQLDA